MKIKNIIFIAVLPLFKIGNQQAKAQTLYGGLMESTTTVQSPEVATMSSYVDRPVSLFNGTVPVTIPLCEVTADGYTLPITLTYNTSGFRPSQEATWVGLGWSLSLNACISRYIKCVDDFLEYNRPRKGYFGINQGYYGSSVKSSSEMTHYGLVYKCPLHFTPCGHDIYATDLVVDSEPDIFSVSLWNCSDKFVLNDDKTSSVKAIFMDRSQGNVLRILSRRENFRDLHFFELVTNDGTVYEFGKRELSSTFSYPGLRCYSDLHPADLFIQDDASLNASAWLLTKITMPSGKSISFLYDEEVYDAPLNETCMRFRPLNTSFPNNLTPELILPTLYGTIPFYEMNAIYTSFKTQIKTARLREIIWDSGAARISFLTSGREDMYNATSFPKPKKLDNIQVFDASGNLVHSFRLNYGYFGSQSGNTDESYLYKRLRLDSVVDMLTPGREYTFEYDESRTFPSKMSLSVDYWGYYNNKNNGADYYCQAYDPLDKTLYSGADKTSDFPSSHLGTLTAVVHPTGGRETFEYELNRFLWPKYVQDGGRHLQTLNLTSLNLPGYYTNEVVETITHNSPMKLTLYGAMVYQSGNRTGWSGTLVTIINASTGSTVWSYYDAVVSTGGYNSMTPKEQHLTLPAGSYKIKINLPVQGWISSWQIDISENSPETYRCDMVQSGGAGLRIKRITGGGKTREFNYSLGELLIDPIFSEKKIFTGTEIEVNPYNQEILKDPFFGEIHGAITGFHPYTQACLVQYSESITPQYTIAKNYLLGYSTVSEHVTGGGHDLTTDYCFSLTKEPLISPDPRQSTMPVFSNGLLQSKTLKDNDSIISREDYLYLDGMTANIKAYGFTYSTGLWAIPIYKFQWYLPSNIKTTVDGSNTITTYSYNSNWQLSNKCTMLKNNSTPVGTSISEYYRYTYESTGSVYSQMAAANIMVPVRELIYTNSQLSGGHKVSYRKENGRFLSDTLFDVKLDAADINSPDSYRPRVTYDRYDDAGNPVQVTRDGITSLYVWGYKSQYPISEITGNMSYNQLVSYVGSSTLTSMRDSANPTNAQFGTLESLRQSLPVYSPGSLMTIRRFKPLVGVTSLTAPNGMVTLYGYDSAGRLSNISRSGGGTVQLVDRYLYNYTGTGSNY